MSDDPTVSELFSRLHTWGAAYMATVVRDADGNVLRAIIVVEGQPEAGEIVAACEALSDEWALDEGAV